MSQIVITPISELKQDEISTIRGWISKIKPFRTHMFVELRDGVGQRAQIQVVMLPDDSLCRESYLQITGKVTALPNGKYSHYAYEMQCSEYQIIGPSSPDFAGKCPETAGPEVKLDQRHLFLRSSEFAIITKLRALFVEALRRTFAKMGCGELIPPCFVGNQCEGGATLFKLKYPHAKSGSEDIDAYLTQSSQFYLEMAVPSIGDCYCIYPSFRAERSHTRRHLTEFLHAECEWKDIFTFEDHLTKIKMLVTETIKMFLLLDEPEGLLTQIGRREAIEHFLELPISILTHAEAIHKCKDLHIYKYEETKTHFDLRDDIPEMQERKLIDTIGHIVLLCKFPKEFKSFYMATDPDDPSYVLGCDVEVPGVGEIIGSGVRVYQAEELKERLVEQGLSPEEYSEYIDLRKYGHARTSGMGLGVDRFLTWLLGKPSIRDVVTFPRCPGRVGP